MDKVYTTPVKSKPNNSENFEVTYVDGDGAVIHGLVKQITYSDFQVYIKEKDVIIHCTKDEDGTLSCKLNSHGNPGWVDGVSGEVAKKLRR